MAAVLAMPERVWTKRVMLALAELVEARLKEHRPRYKRVVVSVEIVSGLSFQIKLEGKEGTFDEEGRAILRRFFTGDFKDRASPLLMDYLGWKNPSVTSVPRDRSTTSYTWQVSCADVVATEEVPSKRKRWKPRTDTRMPGRFAVR